MIPIVIAVALMAFGGCNGYARGKSFAEKRMRDSLVWKENEQRKAEAKDEVDRYRVDADEDFRRKSVAIDSDLAQWLRTTASDNERARSEMEFRLAKLREEYDKLVVWTPRSADSLAGSTVSDSNLARFRKKFDEWLKRDKNDEYLSVLDAEERVRSLRERIGQLERDATAKRSAPKKEPAYKEITERLAAAEKSVRQQRTTLEDEFVNGEVAALLAQVRTKVDGSESVLGLAARLNEIDELAEEVISQTKRHLKTPEEIAAEEEPSLSETIATGVRDGASKVRDGAVKGWNAAKGLFSREKTNADSSSVEQCEK